MSDLLNVSYDTKIPNNVGLSSDRKVLKALEKWHPGYIDWWNKLIPQNFQESMVYLRTAVSVDPKGWAKFDYVKMPDYRWGILLAPEVEDRRIPMGEHKGQKAWQEVPGEYRNMLKRLIVIQGDTEPGSVEQQRFLGLTAPSLYDMRNLFQVNVEEGRHLWAMVYLLQKYFGKDGREEADDMLVRSSGSDDSPRMLGAFNEETPDWLSFFMFTYFTDRDGKMQLESLAQSGFDPLSRTCRFMLTEEAHHMFVGETGVGRTIQATVDAMNKAGITDPTDIGKIRDLGVIDLPTIQKKLNLHYSLSLDLFGQEVSTNAANAFNQGIKGRYMEQRIDDDHQLQNDTYVVRSVVDGQIIAQEVPALTAINMRLRDDYIRDASGGIGRWNKLIAKAGVDFKLFLPDEAFHRQIGVFAAIKTDQEGNIISNDVCQPKKTVPISNR
jgi:benzoyl-CoA 2,3-dioxygenase component B